MKKIWTDNAWEDYEYWQENDRKIVKKINKIIKDIERSPFEGIGKPEPLKYELSGYWSRRITEGHRIVYRVLDDNVLEIVQCKLHYED